MSITANVVGGLLTAKSKIDAIGESPQNEDGTIKGEGDDVAVNKLHPNLVDTAAVVAFGSSLTSMVLTDAHTVDAASFITMGLAPLCAYQKRELKELGGMRGQQNELRQHVNDLKFENDKLTANIDKLEENVGKLEGVETALEQVAKDAKTDSNRLVKIVKEMAAIQNKIKKNLERDVIQSIMSAVIQADNNRDFSINKGEKEMLCLRLKMLPGIDFDEANFRKLLTKDDMELDDVMQLIRNLKDDAVSENDNIFHLKPETLVEQK